MCWLFYFSKPEVWCGVNAFVDILLSLLAFVKPWMLCWLVGCNNVIGYIQYRWCWSLTVSWWLTSASTRVDIAVFDTWANCSLFCTGKGCGTRRSRVLCIVFLCEKASNRAHVSNNCYCNEDTKKSLWGSNWSWDFLFILHALFSTERNDKKKTTSHMIALLNVTNYYIKYF